MLDMEPLLLPPRLVGKRKPLGEEGCSQSLPSIGPKNKILGALNVLIPRRPLVAQSPKRI
ncbi:Hypothetical protein FKW44_003987 [Caligus rogercresseyi]|uniref:Uncharacterized protein n=1 Tax=Caligus rogercresseyi TaxID=217165 RepID=A0A7T8KAY6_CALRO|nr:Hypothetical protein FKW44_003987 [Caligus rogercresseyi]